jgi:hypothetical protein
MGTGSRAQRRCLSPFLAKASDAETDLAEESKVRMMSELVEEGLLLSESRSLDPPFEESRMMTMPQTLRRFPVTIASLALLAIPFGCGSESAAPTSAEVPVQPPVVADGNSTPVVTDVTTIVDQAAKTIDHDVQRTAGSIDRELKGAEAQAAEGAKELDEKAEKQIKDEDKKAEKDAKSVEEAERKAIENSLGVPK